SGFRCAIDHQDHLDLGVGCYLLEACVHCTENYKVWSAAVKLALHTRNKLGFITGKCVSGDNNGPSQEQWDRCNVVVLSWLMQFLMGLVDVFGSVRSIILTSDPIPIRSNNNKRFDRVSNLVCKHCNMTGHTIDRCFELVGYPLGFKKGNGSQSSANNAASNDINTDHNKGVPHTLTNDQYRRLMNLLSDTGFNSKVPDGDCSLRSNDPYDDGGDSADSSSKTAPKSSIDSPADSTVDYIAKDHEMHTDNPGSADLSSSSSIRKVIEDSQYATETYVSKGIKGTSVLLLIMIGMSLRGKRLGILVNFLKVQNQPWVKN
ncbi:ribonuclease H-like domain-containing protein, partial [Tanacetum coccineum]